VVITSPNPSQPPRIAATHLFRPNDIDVEALADGVELARTNANSGSLRRSIGLELSPGFTALDKASIRAWIRQHLSHYHHPVGTCRMGLAADEWAVVDAKGTVHGAERLTIADCSVMPAMPRGNTNVPAAAVALAVAQRLTH
jgi:choline dehydrogenase